VKISSKLVTDLYAFWRIITGSSTLSDNAGYGWERGKRFCLYCDQACDDSVIGAGKGTLLLFSLFFYLKSAGLFDEIVMLL
jgi:hypothetical protein